ncbi:hypothetical protein SteCoe_16097 [Stentor coeruleus]|uniref:Uncharacterized protein n=1 Tax=Stentor coeruleus TaxID=5963 RepID=A0A1R2C254_9CILI|nr:hypothetical protein SteCoe_16097 [Stentor coeruleus]
MLRVIPVRPLEITERHDDQKAMNRIKFIHPRVLKATQDGRPKSPFLLIRDSHQPMNGDLRKKCSCNF